MAPDTLSLAGKVAIVTGSGRENGIGAAIALALARNGASVTINHVSDSVAPRAAAVARKVEEVGGKATVVQVDISTPEGAAKLVNDTLAAFQTDKIDILVNNAAAGASKMLLEETKESIDTLMGTALYGPIFMIQQVVPKMPRGGRIINIGSIASKMGTPMSPVYAAGKASLDTISFASSMQLGRGFGITINTVMPGPVKTESLPPHIQEAIHSRLIPLTRAEEREGRAEDIADAVLLLTSELSRWVTGQTISVSGGITGN
ncbi:NAD(P)-binding protein [Thozetella sp. PMI_491]|nr:NAD(P)-binding protein [Thozetella sp. PMI_491]